MGKFWWKAVISILFVTGNVDRITANCILSMKLDLTHNQPLILSTVTDSWYSLDSTPSGSLQLSRDESVKLACPSHPTTTPNSFANFPSKSEMIAKCTSGNKFEIDKKIYSFDQLQCSFQVKPSTSKAGRACLSPQTELIKVGYPISNSFVTAYEVCIDKETKGTLYTEVDLSPNFAKNDAPVRESAWVNEVNINGDANLDNEYTCPGQAETFHKILGKSYFSQGDKCCFAKAQLVNSQDVAYGTQQLATYHYLNSVPQWSTCNNRANWVEVEKRIRTLATHLQRPLKVWSGTFRTVKSRSKWLIFTSDLYLHYNSKSDKALPIPLYIWKVVHDPQTRKSLAIIQINKPDLVLSDLDSYVLCPDNCHNVNWMNFLPRQTIASGYTYCCDLNDFEFAFQFKESPFPKNAGNILRDDSRASNW